MRRSGRECRHALNFTLDVYDASNTGSPLKSVTLNSGPPLPTAFSNQGLDIDSVNYSHCNGPVTIYQNSSVPTGDLTYLMPIFSGTGEFQDNSVAYQNATNAGTGGTKATFSGWLSANGFTGTEPQAIYFNNGDLKFGRNMHCRVTNTSTDTPLAM